MLSLLLNRIFLQNMRKIYILSCFPKYVIHTKYSHCIIREHIFCWAETCPFGDVPYNVPFQTTGCSEFLGNRATSYNCYQDTYRKSCCNTCEGIRQANAAYEGMYLDNHVFNIQCWNFKISYWARVHHFVDAFIC